MFRNPFLNSSLKRALCCGALLPLVLAGCRTKKDATEEVLKAKAEEAKKAAKSEMAQFGTVLSTGTTYGGYDAKGRPLWKVSAKRARIRNERTDNGVKVPFQANLEGATAQLFRDGKSESSFIAQRILYVKSPRGPILTLSGGVSMTVPPSRLASTAAQKLAARGPITMTAPVIFVDVEAKKLHCSSGATMTQGQSRVVTKQLRADTTLGIAKLAGGMSAQAPEGRIAAREAVWNWRTRRVSATGEVSAWRDNTIIKGARLDADTDAARGEISGGVTAQSNGGTARAARARFDWNRGTLQAEGGVRLEKDGGTLAAARIDTDKDFARAVASGGVTLQKDGATLRADSIQAWDKLARATASGGVTLVKDGATLRADSIQARDKLARAIASGGVTLAKDGATLSAPRVEAWLGEKRATATGGVRVRRADWDVRAATVQSSNLGEATQRVVATGGVRAISGQGSVRAARVDWSAGRVTASGDVQLSRDGNSISGQKLVSDDKFNTARLSGAISGRASGGRVTAREVVWRRAAGASADEGQISATGGVRARWNNLDVRADTLEAAGNGRRATASGGVLLTSDDGATIRAPGARYDRATQTVTATGNVVLNDPKRGIAQRGRTLVYDMKTRTATLTDVSGQLNRGLLNKKLF